MNLASPLKSLEKRVGANWSQLNAARERAVAKRRELQSSLRGYAPGDTSIVVFGSLGRDEFTDASDIDWTLLIDGQADPNHLGVTRRIGDAVERLSKKEVGREGLFGSMAFSHELVHRIGGEDDTNKNATRRILLLLESKVIGRSDAYKRVISAVLKRYVLEDHGFISWSGKYHVPRFLLNDFARFWWTMAVDFAYKSRTRFGKGSAIRNVKLRFSRKLIYVSGLLTCFGCQIEELRPAEGCPSKGSALECVDCLQRRLRQTPMNILANFFLHFPHLDNTARRIFDAYEGFLGILADESKRTYLEKLDTAAFETDEMFRSARMLSHDFRDGLLDLFFDEKSGIYELTRNYGVF
jgi:predicted nucleotidyltransferase